LRSRRDSVRGILGEQLTTKAIHLPRFNAGSGTLDALTTAVVDVSRRA
jgi:hypothetical protein